MPTKHSVTINAEVFTRSSDRDYKYVVAVLADIRRARHLATNPSDADRKVWRSNYAYYSGIATAYRQAGSPDTNTVVVLHVPAIGGKVPYYREQIKAALEVSALSEEQYCTGIASAKAERFLHEANSGKFRWYVYRWSATEKAANQAAKSLLSGGYFSQSHVIQVGASVELPIVRLEDLETPSSAL